MVTMIISEYQEGVRTATVYRRDNGFRIVLLDSYFETQDEKYANTIDEAEDIAENWVLHV